MVLKPGFEPWQAHTDWWMKLAEGTYQCKENFEHPKF